MSVRMWQALGLTLLGLGLTALLAAAGWLAWSRSNASRVGELPYVPLAVDKSLGITTDLSRLNAEERRATLTAMEEAGFRWLRQRFPWDGIEPEPAVYKWELWDQIVDDAARHNLQVVAVLDGSPAWARATEDDANLLAPPTETRPFGDFATAFAMRYGDSIDYYQVWDEPNIAPHWGARDVDPAAYARLLREGSIRIRASDAGAVILTAALAPNVEPGGANMSDLLFLDELYKQGAAEWFDVVAVQPYDLEGSLATLPNADLLTWRRPALLRQVMEAHGDARTAIWAVAFGLRERTANAVWEAVEQVREDWPWLGPMFWTAWSPQDPHGDYALTDATGKPGPLSEAFQSLAQTSSLAWPGAYTSDHPSGHYEGDWRVTPNGADIGSTGDRLRILFRGTDLHLVLRRGDYRAFLFVTVDDQPANGLPRDADGRAYVVLYDPLREMETVAVARGLTDGEHVAEIVAERGWGQWAIVGWSVSRQTATGQRWPPLALGIAACVVLGVTVYLAWRWRSLLTGSVSILVGQYRTLDDRVALLASGGAAVLLYIMTGTLPTLVVLGLLALLLLLRPGTGLPLIALALPFYQLGRPLLGKVFSMVEILILLTALGWLLNWALKTWSPRQEPTAVLSVAAAPRLNPHGSPPWYARATTLDWGVLALLGIGALSLLWAEYFRVAAREFRTVILEASVFYALLRVMVEKERSTGTESHILWRIVDAWVLGAVLIALVGLYQWVFGQNLIMTEGVWRVRGLYGSPNNLALYLGKVFPLALALAVWGRRGRPMQVAYGLATLLMAAALFLTYSRGAWIVGVPASLLFIAVLRGRRALAVAVLLLAIFALIMVLALGAGRLTSLLDTAEGTTFFRLQLWLSSVAMIRDHPLLGVGLDNFLYHYRTYYVLPTAWEEFNLSHPHNLVLDFWLRLGLPGLGVLLWLLVQFFRSGWRSYRRLPENNQRVLALGLMAGMVNFVAHGLVDNAFFLVDLAFVFMLIVALIQAVNGERSPIARSHSSAI